MAKDTGKKLADMLYGQPFDVPTPENLRLGQQMIERELREKAARDAKLTPLDKAKAAYEAAKMMGSAAVAGIGSIPTRIVRGPEAAEKYVADRLSIPTTEKGMEYVGDIGDFLERLETQYKLPPILPEAAALQHVTGPAAKQAIRQGAANLSAPRTLSTQAGAVMIPGKFKAPQDVLPAAEREANLAKMLEKSATKERLYHATPADFSQFKPGGNTPEQSGPAIWMTPDKDFQPAAHNIRRIPDKPNYMYGSSSNMFTPGTNVMPVYSSVKNPLITNEKTWRQDFKEFGGSPWTLTPNEVQKIKGAGHDGIMYYDKDGKLQEVVAFEPQQVKSAIGNRGTYDINEPDITKADGGSVHISDNPDTMALELAGGGLVEKLAKLARAVPKTRQEIEAIAERLAPQVTGEYVRESAKSAKTVAGKTKKQFERERDLPVDIRATKEERIPQPIDIEKLKGEVMIGIPGDPTVTGKTLYSVGEHKLGSPSPQHGGPQYGLYHDDDHFWASGLGAARRVQNLAREAAQQYDAPVAGNYIMMGPESINYAQHFADANLQAIDLSKMTKRQIEGFDKLIRQGSPTSGPRPSFPGIEDKESAYLHMAMDPELRKHFNDLMQKNTVTEAFNLPSGHDIRYAITEPALRDLETGVTGYSLGRMRPDIPASELKLSEHPTYTHDIPGHFLGQSPYPMPYELSFPDTLRAIRENPKQAPHEFGSLKMVGPRQIIDQQMIDEIKAYEERMKQLTGKKKGGAVSYAEGGDISADDLILEERKL